MVTYQEVAEKITRSVMDKTRIYMIETFLSTYDMRQRSEVPFKLFPRQKEFVKALSEYQNNITTKPRQAGVTTTCAAYIACEIALASPESPETILVIGNKMDLARQMVTKIREFIIQFPRYFWGEEYYSPDPKSLKNKKDIFVSNNKDEFTLFNKCKVLAKSSGTNAARGVSSVSHLVFDEAAFIENGNSVYAQAVATTSTGGKITMISTPQGRDQLYFKTYSQALTGENNFHITELKWYQDPRYNKFLKWTRKDEETGKVSVIEEKTIDKEGSVSYDEERWKKLEHDGWKATSPWYVNMCGKFNNDTQKIAQELDISFVGSSNTVVEPEVIQMQRETNVREPLPDFKDNLFPEVWMWKPPIEGHRYLIACDPARGDGADRTVIQVIDIDGRDEYNMPIIEQVMEYAGKIYGDITGQLLYKYGKLYGNAFIVVDAIGGVGDASLLTLKSLGYENLYYDDPNLKKYTAEREITSFSLSDEKLPGFHCGAVRFQMLSNFVDMIRNNEFKIRSTRVIGEMETWIFKNGRMDHMEGAHDDTLTSLAMGLFVMKFSINRLERIKEMDKALLSSWINNTSKTNDAERSINKGERIISYSSSPNGNYMEFFNSNKNKKNKKFQVAMWITPN